MKNLLFPVFVFALLLSAAASQLQAQIILGSENKEQSQIGITISGGLNIPLEEFGKTGTEKSGFATPGFGFSVEYDRPVAELWNWSTTVSFAVNGMDEEAMRTQMNKQTAGNFSVTTGKYSSLWVLTGAGYTIPNTKFYTQLQIGVLQSSFPDITISNSTASIKQTTTSNTVVAVAITLAYKFQNYTAGVRVNSAQPKYSQTAVASVGNISDKTSVELPMDILLVYFGITF